MFFLLTVSLDRQPHFCPLYFFDFSSHKHQSDRNLLLKGKQTKYFACFGGGDVSGYLFQLTIVTLRKLLCDL